MGNSETDTLEKWGREKQTGVPHRQGGENLSGGEESKYAI